MKKLLLCVVIGFFCLVFSYVRADVEADAASPIFFTEIWGYLISGEEKYFTKNSPVTDIGYFSAKVSLDGSLRGVPDASKINHFGRRIHLVIAETSDYSLTHFILRPDLPFRAELLDSIAVKSKPFAGVQIDFEAVRPADKDNFISFLYELKAKIKEKTLSVALPARRKKVNDAFDYEKISKAVDRIIIMAYDEHWSTSKPGPVASNTWCREVSAYAAKHVPQEKLVMGIPFYGRAWIDKNPAKAYINRGVNSLIKMKNLSVTRTADGIPNVRYTETVEVSLYYDDEESLWKKFGIYKNAGAAKIAFWRIGQENPGIWQKISSEEK